MDQQRFEWDLTHETHRVGQIGRLQMLSWCPVIAGDSLQLDLDGPIRFAPMRREIVGEAQIDICGFYMPWRHVFGDDWSTFVQEGVDGSDSFLGDMINVGVSGERYPYLLMNTTATSVWRPHIEFYNRVWDRFYRVPHRERDADYETVPTGTTSAAENWRQYGRLCARLPHPLIAGTTISGAPAGQSWRDLNDADFEAIVGGADIDIRSLEEGAARARAEIERVWKAGERYKDILGRQWGTSVNIDADERPEMCFRETFDLSGRDLSGADDATLGMIYGRAAGRLRASMARKMFMENGCFGVFMLVRFPMVHTDETHPFLRPGVVPDGQLLMADPDYMRSKRPITHNPGNWLQSQTSGTDDNIQVPFGNEYRLMPNFVHPAYEEIPGYPFSKISASDYAANPDNLYYYQNEEYNDVFNTWQMAHWQASAKIRLTRYSTAVPPVNASLFVGAKD